MASCEECGQNFTRRDSFNRHINEVHKAVSRRVHPNRRERVIDEEPYSECWQGGGTHLSKIGEACVPGQSNVESEDDDRESTPEQSDAQEHTDQESADDDLPNRRKRKRQEDVFDHDTDGDSSGDDLEWQRGIKRKRDPPDMESNENTENEEETESDSYCVENPSSDDSDDCESSSECSSENDEEITKDGSRAGEIAESEEKEPQKPYYLSLARWRDPDNGVYTGWRSFNRTPHVVKHRVWLNNLMETPYKLQKALIMEASESQLDAFREIALNVLRGRAAMHCRTFRGFGKCNAAIHKLGSEESDYYTLRRTLLAGRVDLLPLLLIYATPSCIKSPKVVGRPDISDD